MTVPPPLTRTAVVDGPVGAGDCEPGVLRRREHGAIASFLGVVRDEHRGRAVTGIDYDCYRDMAERILVELVAEARARFDADLQVVVVHGTGRMDPGEVSLAIHVSSTHRVAAFDACRHLLERIKQDLPVWKHEHYADGDSLWLAGS